MSNALKIINLGLPKSGTTTLGEALSKAGLRVADWRVRKGDPNATRPGYVGALMYAGYFKRQDPLIYLRNFDAFSQIDVVRHGRNFWPQTDWGLLSRIIDLYPGAKFLLSYRQADDLAQSMERWSDLGAKRLPGNEMPGLPLGYGASIKEREIWIEGHYRFCRQVFQGRDNFLEYDLYDPDAKDRIAAFLGLELPWWGVANRNESRPADVTGTGS